MGESLKDSPLLLNVISRALLSPPAPLSFDVINAAPSPASSPGYYPPIFLPPSFPVPSPSPLPSAASHSSLPEAAIVGGSVAGAVVALTATATIISAVTGKVGISSCILAPLLKLLQSFLGGKLVRPFVKLGARFRNLWFRIRPKRQGSDNKTVDASGLAHQDINHLGGAANAYYQAQSPGPSAQSFLSSHVSEFANGELQKQKELIMQPLNHTVLKAEEYFESLYSDMSNAKDAMKSSAHAYLDEVAKLKASAERIGRPDIVLMLGELAIQAGAERIKSNGVGIEHAAEQKRPQNVQHDPLEEVVATSSLRTGKENCQHIEDSSKLQVEEMTIDLLNRRRTDQKYVSVASPDEGAIQPTAAGPIVPVPTKAITPVTAQSITSAAARKPTWQLSHQQGEKGRNRPANLGRASFSCEMSAFRLNFFTSCRSGGSYGSPPPARSHAGDDMNFYSGNKYGQMHDLDLDSSSIYNNSLASHAISYGGNSHVGFLTSSGAPIKQHYNIASVQNQQQSSTDSISAHQMALPYKSNNGSNSNAAFDYGSPFDGVL